MSQRFQLSRDAVLLTLGGLLLALPLFVLAGWVAYKHQWGADRLAEIEPRYARLLGLQMQTAEIYKLEAQARTLLSKYTYLGSLDASKAGNDGQQKVRDVFTRAGMEVVSIQVLPAKVEKQFDKIPIVLKAEGELIPLQSALTVLAEQSPAVVVDGFTIQTVGLVKAEVPQRLAIQFNLSVLRVRE